MDIFFSPNFLFSAFSKKCKKVLTVHDLSFEVCPQFFSLKARLWHKFVRTKKMCREADVIIAVSESTKRDIINVYGIEAEKIKVIYSGICLERKNQKTTSCEMAYGLLTDLPVCESIKLTNSITYKNNLSSRFTDNSLKDVEIGGIEPPKRGLIDSRGKPAIPTSHLLYQKKISKTRLVKKKYILYLGNVEKRKNIIGIIDAYNLLVQKYKIVDYDLIIAGKQGYGHRFRKRFLHFGRNDNDFGPSNSAGRRNDKRTPPYPPLGKGGSESANLKLSKGGKVKFVGYVDENKRSELYKNASLFVYPSFYEGFGFPPLEAMANGCPVITSNVSSLPESVGDSGLLVDPYNVADIAMAMSQILTDSELRLSLIKKGFERVKNFSWENTARETLEMFRELA
ncbi:glycosyltransferase family 4 protein [Patescibacteria group bacterium]